MKSLETNLLGLYGALVDDLCAFYPEENQEWMRDLTRLTFLVSKRGSLFITVDLPEVGKHLDRCLSNSIFLPSRLPGQGRLRGCPMPRLFGALYTKIFDTNGLLREDVDIVAVKLLRQLYYAGKKVHHDCSPKALYRAVKEFFDVEKEIRAPTLDWDGDPLLLALPTSIHLHDDAGLASVEPSLFGDYPNERRSPSFHACVELTQRLADVFSTQIGEIPIERMSPRHGPGAVSDLKAGMNKYSFHSWSEKLEQCFPYDQFAVANGSFAEDNEDLRFRNRESPSKLCAVPKTQKGPRLIASEPLAHQWCQQALRAGLLYRFGYSFLQPFIDFADQRKSQVAALDASTHGGGCTIDLSSASDRLSTWVVERVFRRNTYLLNQLHSCRTRWLVNSIDKKSPKFVKLRKFAPMGSAVTFPVQSIVYSLVSLAATIVAENGPATRWSHRRLMNEVSSLSGRVVVFGDDMIVPEAAYSLVTEVMTYLGLKVNVNKTFVGGNFYESCGVDAYRGVDVTPIYYLQDPIESDPNSIVSAVASSNNLFRGGLWRCAQWLTSRLPKRFLVNLPITRETEFGLSLYSFCGSQSSHLKSRWNDQLQRSEQRVLTFVCKESRAEGRGPSALLQYFTERPAPIYKWESGWTQRRNTKLRLTYSMNRSAS